MYISRFSIVNFRNFKNAYFTFTPGVNTLIGENGSGKTNAFFGLRILLDDSLKRNVSKLQETDFNRELIDWRGHWIILSLEFEDLDSSETLQCLAVNGLGIPEGEQEEGQEPALIKGNYNFFFRPNFETRKTLFEFSQRKKEAPNSQDLGFWRDEFKKVIEGIKIDSYEPYLTCRALNTDFNDEAVYQNLVGDFINLDFPDPGEQKIDVLGVNVSSIPSFSIFNEISCTFAKALRDVVSDLKNSWKNPLAALLRDQEDAIPEDVKEKVEKDVKSLNNKISGLKPVGELSQKIVKALQDSVGETYSPNVGIEADLPIEFNDLLGSLKLRVSDDDTSDHKGDIRELSLGGANLIYITLKLLEYDLKMAKDKPFHLLFIEEPEAHIHTHIQKTLFSNVVGNDKTQVIYSTHSTHISAVSKIKSVNVLHKVGRQAKVFHPATGLDDKQEIPRLERFLDAIRTNLLFAKSVILVEGDGEELLLPTVVNKVFGVSFDEMGIGLINNKSTQFLNLAQIFHPDRIQKNCAIVTDLDSTFDGTESQASKIALTRKQELEAYCGDNEWVEPFYAEYTFEVELFRCGNQSLMAPLIEELYPGDHANTVSARQNIEAGLGSSDIKVYGEAVLKLAKRMGKGWFALLLAERIDHSFKIPGYILDAIKFVCQDLPPSVLFKIAKHRVFKNLSLDTAYQEVKGQIPLGNRSLHKDFLKFFAEKLPEDPLTKILPTYDL